MHLAIVSAFSYPDGGAAAARHLALAAGLAATGHRVSFVLLRQNEIPAVADRAALSWIPAGALPRSPIGWRLAAARRMRGALGAAAAVRPLDAVLLTSHDPILMEAGVRAGRSLRAPVLHELTEYPDVVAAPGIAGAVTRLLYEHRQLPRLDGVLVISTALQRFVSARTTRPTRLVSGIVDLAANPVLPPLTVDGEFVIGYAGHLSQVKDGVCDLLRAVAAAQAELGSRVDLRVELVGDTATASARAARQLATDLGVARRVCFRGRVPQARVREFLARSHLLALPRPQSRQAEGGFPTKLGEYLSTGRPVVATGVGDLPRYLRDGDTCVLVPPGDVAALARSIARAALDYDRARLIGARGRQLAERSFAADRQAAQVASFVDELSVPAVRPRLG